MQLFAETADEFLLDVYKLDVLGDEHHVTLESLLEVDLLEQLFAQKVFQAIHLLGVVVTVCDVPQLLQTAGPFDDQLAE